MAYLPIMPTRGSARKVDVDGIRLIIGKVSQANPTNARVVPQVSIGSPCMGE
jgi:hypothetical protein